MSSPSTSPWDPCHIGLLSHLNTSWTFFFLHILTFLKLDRTFRTCSAWIALGTLEHALLSVSSLTTLCHHLFMSSQEIITKLCFFRSFGTGSHSNQKVLYFSCLSNNIKFFHWQLRNDKNIKIKQVCNEKNTSTVNRLSRNSYIHTSQGIIHQLIF